MFKYETLRKKVWVERIIHPYIYENQKTAGLAYLMIHLKRQIMKAGKNHNLFGKNRILHVPYTIRNKQAN